jgi:hypothetical protein
MKIISNLRGGKTMKMFMVVIAVVSFVFMASVCSAQSTGRIFQVAVYCDNRLEHPSLTTNSEFVGDTGRGELGPCIRVSSWHTPMQK